MRNFPEVLQEGEEIVITEKLHGTNAKIARIEGEWMAGSMTVRRKMPTDGSLLTSLYWYPLTLPGVKELLEGLEQAGHSQAILYGEVVGSKVQNLSYGFEGALGFRAFDILVDGKYLDYDTFDITCRHFGIETVPLLYRGPFSLDVVKNLSSGKTVLQASHIREGVVVKPVVERIDPKVGRVVLKYISDEYLFGKEKGKVTDTEDI
jgi:RNA ligase (TIGR02306 family)